MTLKTTSEDKEVQEPPHKDIPVEELQISTRAYNGLKRARINTVADLLDNSEEDLLKIKNFGQKSAEEVILALNEHLGITLSRGKSA